MKKNNEYKLSFKNDKEFLLMVIVLFVTLISIMIISIKVAVSIDKENLSNDNPKKIEMFQQHKHLIMFQPQLS